MFQSIILMMCGVSFISRATDTLNIEDAQIHMKYSDFNAFKYVFLKENFESVKNSWQFLNK